MNLPVKEYNSIGSRTVNGFTDCTSEHAENFKMLNNVQTLARLGSWDLFYIESNFSWSPETFRIFGRDPEDFIPTFENVLDCVHPADRTFVSDTLIDSLKDGQSETYELKYRIIHGKTNCVRWVYQKYYHIKNDDGTLYRSAGIVQDVTDNENLLKEYGKFYNAVKFARNPFIITDKDFRINYVNPQCEKFYRYDLAELREKNALFFCADMNVYLDNGYTQKQYERLFRKIQIDTLSLSSGSWEGELISSTKDGEIKWVHTFIYAIRDMNGGLHSFVITLIDVTEEKKKEENDRVEIYNAIASLAEHRDNDTGKHMKRIGEFCRIISEKLGMPKIYSEDIGIFAPLHDIGKVGISDEILRAPRALTQAEFTVMKTHAGIGYDILKNRSKLEMAAAIAGSHHEKYDGSGYPRGIKGENIPLSARICAVADVYDALRTERPYKDAFSEEKAVQIILEGSGTHFDPVLVSILIENRGEFDKVFEKMMD